MKTTTKLFCALAALVIASVAPTAVRAQSGGGFEILKYTFAPGGPVSGGTFELNNASGQHDAGVHTGGGYTLYGGFFGPNSQSSAETPTPTAMAMTPSPTAVPPTPTAMAPTATPMPYCCPGDADNSGGFVDAADFVGVQINFGGLGPRGIAGDADCSGGFVDASDFVGVQINFGNVCVNP